MMLAPRQLWTSQQPMEESFVERIEDFIEVVISAFRAAIALGSSRVPDLFRLASDSLTVLKAFVSMIVRAVDRLLVDLRDQNVCDRVQHRDWRALEKVRKTDMQFTVPEPDRCVQGNKTAEPNAKGRHGRARPKRPVFLLKNLNDVLCHQFGD